MNAQEKNGTKKSRGRPAIGQGEQIQVRLQKELLNAVDEFRLLQPDLPNRQEAIRRILAEKLTRLKDE